MTQTFETTHPSGQAHGKDGGPETGPPEASVGHMPTAVANILGALDRLEKSNETRVTSREIKRMLRPMRLCTQLPWVHEPFLKTQPGLPPAGAVRPPPATPDQSRWASKPGGEPRTEMSGTRR